MAKSRDTSRYYIASLIKRLVSRISNIFQNVKELIAAGSLKNAILLRVRDELILNGSTNIQHDCAFVKSFDVIK